MVTIARIDDPCGECLLGEAKCATTTHGRQKAKVLIVCPPPQTQQLAIDGKNLSNRSMRTLSAALKSQGFGRNDLVFVNAIRCGYDPDIWTSKERNQIVKPCREYLLRTIDRMKPEVIIPLGAMAARQVENRQVKIMKARGVPTWSEEHEAWVMPMLDPAYVNLYPQHQPTFNVDCKTLRSFLDSNLDLETMAEHDNHYELVDDLQFLIDENPRIVAFDVETQGLRPKERDTKLLSLQFTTKAGEGFMVLWDKKERPAGIRQKRKLVRQMRELLCRPEVSVIGQNLKFDAVWLYAETGIRIRCADDTLMLTTLLDENSNDKGLDHQTKVHIPEMAGYNDHFNSKYDKSDMDAVPLEDFVPYGCGDTDASFRLCKILRHEVMQDRGLWQHYRYISMPGINTFVGVEGRGMHIHRDALDAFAITLGAAVEEQRKDLLRRVPRAVKRKHAHAGIKFSRRDFLGDILFSEAGFNLEPRVYTKGTQKLSEEKRIPSTSSKDHLPFFYDDRRPLAGFVSGSQAENIDRGETVGDFVIDLAEYVKQERLLSTNVVGFRKKYMVGDYIYPTYSLWTAVTGRTASKDPNGQNFPKRGKAAKAYRRIFIPPPEMIMVAADLSQAELRIAGDMANDREMIRIYNVEGGDIHLETACLVMGISMEQFNRRTRDEQALARFKAKAVNFGFIYGMGWRKFIIYAKTQYGVEFTEREAQRIRNGFFRKYGQLPTWHGAMREFAQDHGYVRSYSGRIRHLPMIESSEDYVKHEAERQGINSPVQEFASSLGVMAMGRLDLEIDERYLALTGFVHDAIYAYCPPQYVEWAARTLKGYMESNDIEGVFGIKMKVPITADVEFGWNGAEMYEMGHLPEDRPYDFDALAQKYADEDTGELPDFYLPEQETPPDDGMRDIPEYLLAA